VSRVVYSDFLGTLLAVVSWILIVLVAWAIFALS
jgi:hypothetical protein